LENLYGPQPISGGVLKPADGVAFITYISELFAFHEHAMYEIAEVPLTRVVPLCNFVYTHRLGRARVLLAAYENAGLAPFEPAVAIYQDGQAQIIAPPILEDRAEGLILCDGMHRVVLARRLGLGLLTVLVVKGATTPLPGETNAWENVQEAEEQKPVEENFVQFKPAGWTGYTKILNSAAVWCKRGDQVEWSAEEALSHLLRRGRRSQGDD